MDDNNITNLEDRRRNKPVDVAMMTMPPPQEQPAGPFTVTISDSSGKMFEVVFPDYHGVLAKDQGVLGSTGIPRGLVVNLLTGALRVFEGAP